MIPVDSQGNLVSLRVAVSGGTPTVNIWSTHATNHSARARASLAAFSVTTGGMERAESVVYALPFEGALENGARSVAHSSDTDFDPVVQIIFDPDRSGNRCHCWELDSLLSYDTHSLRGITTLMPTGGLTITGYLDVLLPFHII